MINVFVTYVDADGVDRPIDYDFEVWTAARFVKDMINDANGYDSIDKVKSIHVTFEESK